LEAKYDQLNEELRKILAKDGKQFFRFCSFQPWTEIACKRHLVYNDPMGDIQYYKISMFIFWLLFYSWTKNASLIKISRNPSR